MNQEIKFSICIPNYNYANYIGKTIESVLCQTYGNFEILVADNASTDNSVQIIKGFDDSRIKLIQNNINVGFAPNLDKASAEAIGDYMLMLSSDDLMDKRALEVYAKQILEHDGLNQPLVLCASLDVVDEHDQLMKGRKRFALNRQIIKGLENEHKIDWNKVQAFEGKDLLRHALSENFVVVGRFLTLCYSRKLYKKVEGYRSGMTIMPDTHFSHKLMTQNPKVLVIPEVLFSYRVHSNNNYAAIYTHPKLAIDAYQMSQMYRNDILAPLGITNNVLRKNFVIYWGVISARSNSLNGNVWYGFRLWNLVWSTYPNLYRKYWIAWAFPLFALLTYPIRLMLRLRKKSREI